MNHIEKYIGIGLLVCAVGFNLWLYRLEPTALVDPNDNHFQYALVHRTNEIWDFAAGQCRGVTKPFCMTGYLVDHWVPNWAQGYNLPYYYSHIPQLLIVASWRILSVFSAHYTLFTHYHWVIYILYCFFPLSVFLALRIIKLSWVAAGLGAFAAAHISTDGLYGLDPVSFLWRGYGLSSQLFSMIWLPLALAFAFRGRLIATIGALAATTAGHLGIGIMAFMSIGVLAISSIGDLRHLKTTLKQMGIVYAGTLLILSYWIVPLLIDGNYHNISVWDGIWKFDSFGAKTVLTNFFNGDLFDFGRAPILTALVVFGLFTALFSSGHISFSMLFLFWLLLYFGRTTWGGFIDLIPGMGEFHLSRFIVGVHIAGIFLMPLAVDRLMALVRPAMRPVAFVLLPAFIMFTIAPQTIRYAAHNDFLIKRGNTDFQKDEADISHLFTALKSHISKQPGRVFAGRGGSWGKDFRIAETPMFMHLSTYGIPIILWLPETWSPNSDTEQYFSEGNEAHYSLYNVRYVVTPATLGKEHIQPFWKHIESGKNWHIYSVGVPPGYITSGTRPAIVSSSKEDFRNVVRHWMNSKDYLSGLYPELTFDTDYPKNTGLPNFRMLDEVTYRVPARNASHSDAGGPAGTTHNVFADIPRYSPPSPTGALAKVGTQSQNANMIFTASVDVPPNCTECLVILKQTYHPSWKATVDGKKTETFAVFPFYTAVLLSEPGTHEIIFSYKPSIFKKILLLVNVTTLIVLFIINKAYWFKYKFNITEILVPRSR